MLLLISVISESPFYKFEIIVRYQPRDDSSKVFLTRFGDGLPFVILRFEYTKQYPLEVPAIEIPRSKHVSENNLEEILAKLMDTVMRIFFLYAQTIN